MWLKRLPILLLLCCLLVLSPGTCSAAEYRMTETELTRLEQIFQQLQINNKQLLTDLEQSETDLATARQKLEEYQKDLVILQAQLQALKTESAQARNELATANSLLEKVSESCKQLEAENKHLNWQRGALVLAVGILAFR